MLVASAQGQPKVAQAGATVILDGDSITEEHLKKAGFATLDPLAELGLDEYNVVIPDITSMTREALKQTGLDNKAVVKCKNMFALGICFWLFDRPEAYALQISGDQIRTEKSGRGRSQQARYRRRL